MGLERILKTGGGLDISEPVGLEDASPEKHEESFLCYRGVPRFAKGCS